MNSAVALKEIDNLYNSSYNDFVVGLIAKEAAERAVVNVLNLLNQPGQAKLENCNEQEKVCSDENGGLIMSPRVKAKLNLNGQDVWFSASSVQQLVNSMVKAIDDKDAADNDNGVSLQEYADSYINRYKDNGSIENNTLVGYRGYLKNHIYPFFGNMPIGKITVDVLQDYVNLKAKTLSQKSIHEHINLMRQIFASAVEDGLMDKNPCLSSKLQIVGSKSTKIMAYTEDEFAELESMLDYLEGTDKAFLALSLYTGMRQGELFALQWEDIDLTNDLIHVTKAVEWAGENRGRIKAPKTENGNRIIVIIPQLAEVLRLVQKPKGYVLIADRQKPDEPMTHQAVKRLNERIENIGKAHGCKTRFLSHRARHTVATFLNNAGADDVSITGIIGHSDVAFTKRQYANTQTRQIERGMEKLSDYISKISA